MIRIISLVIFFGLTGYVLWRIVPERYRRSVFLETRFALMFLAIVLLCILALTWSLSL
jgi:cytochrome b subunit of formate dehydrogenase